VLPFFLYTLILFFLVDLHYRRILP
jgi:hypothetical protein